LLHFFLVENTDIDPDIYSMTSEWISQIFCQVPYNTKMYLLYTYRDLLAEEHRRN